MQPRLAQSSLHEDGWLKFVVILLSQTPFPLFLSLSNPHDKNHVHFFKLILRFSPRHYLSSYVF